MGAEEIEKRHSQNELPNLDGVYIYSEAERKYWCDALQVPGSRKNSSRRYKGEYIIELKR